MKTSPEMPPPLTDKDVPEWMLWVMLGVFLFLVIMPIIEGAQSW